MCVWGGGGGGKGGGGRDLFIDDAVGLHEKSCHAILLIKMKVCVTDERLQKGNQ